MKFERKLPPKPDTTVDPETGKRTYEGSLSASVGLSLSREHQNLVLRELLDGPRMPADLLAATGLSKYNPFHHEGIQRYLLDLVEQGEAVEVRDPQTDKFLGWRHTKAKEGK